MHDYIGPCVLVLNEFLILKGPVWIQVLKSLRKLLLPVRHQGGDLVPFPTFIFLFFDIGLLFPRIRAPRASFKAVLDSLIFADKFQILVSLKDNCSDDWFWRWRVWPQILIATATPLFKLTALCWTDVYVSLKCSPHQSTAVSVRFSFSWMRCRCSRPGWPLHCWGSNCLL